MQKTLLKGLSLAELREFVQSFGERPFRGDQLFNWIYNKGVTDFAAMLNLPQQIRAVLQARARLDALTVGVRRRSADGTMKVLFTLGDGLQIESVLIPPQPGSPGGEKRLTACVSTQVGCPLDCQFCATGTMGFLRNLDAGEIVDQVLQLQIAAGRRITNIVYMGMGEPLLNYEAAVKSARILTDDRGIAIGARRVTISTAGIPAAIRRLAGESLKIKLAMSLHSLDPEKRTRLMPITRKFPLQEVLGALQDYYQSTRRRPTFEYIVLRDFNDADIDVARLVSVAKRIPCKINLIPYHSIAFTNPQGIGRTLVGASRPEIERFAAALRKNDVTVMVRSSSGEDIEAACGQLAVRAAGNEKVHLRAQARVSEASRADMR